MTPKEWLEAGRPDLLADAIAQKDKILSEAQNQIIPEIDEKVRQSFKMFF
jgi:trimethylamine--corrinoid protein Co-methyltransferase